MKKILLLACLLCASPLLRAQTYVFFLHNMFIELEGLNGVHPEYGKVEYSAVIDSFHKRGFVVFSEIRPKGTNGNVYAKKIAAQVDSLLRKGVDPAHITVVGTSKGGFIAMYVSSLVKNKDVNYVIIGSCGSESENDKDITLYGNILSIYEKSDKTTSCRPTSTKDGGSVTRFKEILLNTGLKHGFLYKALPQWIQPASAWCSQQYNLIQ